MTSMEVEFTEEQLEKIEILKSKDISVGQAIDLLFEIQNEALAQIEDQKEEKNILGKIKDNTLDTKIKAELLNKGYSEQETYDKTVQEAKRRIKWSDFI